ncbi:MAG: hypothetical protein HY599_00220 [Candidatus Omnitrophica bacterium]|nr:hypothetical protein [Candidatus Omnitrophota bacterium]
MARRSKTDQLLDFEISFYEKLLRVYPQFVDVLTPLGDAYTRRGLYEKGLEIDLRLAQMRQKDPVTWYNLACSYSLLNRLDDALVALRRALELGYADAEYLLQDPDLLNLRQSPQYRQFLTAFPDLAAKSSQAAPRPSAQPERTN